MTAKDLESIPDRTTDLCGAEKTPLPPVAEPSAASGDDQLLRQAWGALNFILAFYQPGQRYLDTEAWKQAEAGGKRAHDAISARLGNSGGWWRKS